MNTASFQKVLLVILLLSVFNSSFANEYCVSKGVYSQHFWVNTLSINDRPLTSGQNDGYFEHLNMPIELNAGNNTIAVNPGYRSYVYGLYWSGWLDLNHDGAFTSDEQVFSFYSQGARAQTFTLPDNVVSGVTTLRVAMKYGNYASPCESYYYGETEDVLVQLESNDTPVVPAQSHTLKLDYDFTVQRDGLLEDDATWVVEKDGVVVLRRNAKGELKYRYYNNTTGSDIVIWLERFVDGHYQQISNEVTYTPGTSDLFELDLLSGYQLQRSGELGDSVQWVIEKDGEIVLQRNAANELNYTYFQNSQGSQFKVWLKQAINGEYKTVSNVVSYEVGQNQFNLSVDADFSVYRNGQLGDAVQWVIEKDGNIVLERNAAAELEYTYFANTPGASVRVWLKMFVNGGYQVVSNIVEYQVPAAFPFQLAVASDYTLTRSGTLGDNVQWVIVKNGNTVLRRNAANELSYKYFSNTSGSSIQAYLQQFQNGQYVRVSNTVTYTVN